jgi:hypothetical protein
MSSFGDPPFAPPPGPPPPGAPAAQAAWAQAPAGKSYNGLAIGSLVCGIASLLMAGVILGPVAVILGVIARRGMRNSGNRQGSGMALAGIITGAIGAIVMVAGIGLVMLVGMRGWR